MIYATIVFEWDKGDFIDRIYTTKPTVYNDILYASMKEDSISMDLDDGDWIPWEGVVEDEDWFLVEGIPMFADDDRLDKYPYGDPRVVSVVKRTEFKEGKATITYNSYE